MRASPMPLPLSSFLTQSPSTPLWSTGVFGANLRTSHQPTTCESTSETIMTMFPSEMPLNVFSNHLRSSSMLGFSLNSMSPNEGSASASGKKEKKVSMMSLKSEGVTSNQQ